MEWVGEGIGRLPDHGLENVRHIRLEAIRRVAIDGLEDQNQKSRYDIIGTCSQFQSWTN